MLDIAEGALGKSRVKLHVPLSTMLSQDSAAEADAVTKSSGARPRRPADSLDHIRRR